MKPALKNKLITMLKKQISEGSLEKPAKEVPKNDKQVDPWSKAKGATKTALKKYFDNPEFMNMTSPQKVDLILSFIGTIDMDTVTKQKLRAALPKLVAEAIGLRNEEKDDPVMPDEIDAEAAPEVEPV